MGLVTGDTYRVQGTGNEKATFTTEGDFAVRYRDTILLVAPGPDNNLILRTSAVLVWQDGELVPVRSSESIACV